MRAGRGFAAAFFMETRAGRLIKTEVSFVDEKQELLPEQENQSAPPASAAENAAESSAPAAELPAENAEGQAPAAEPSAAEPSAAENAAESSAENAEGELHPVEPPKRKRKWLWNLILVVLIGLGIYSMFGISGEINGGGMSFTEALSRIDAAGLVLLLAVILLTMTADCCKFLTVNKAVLGKFRPLVALKTSFLGKFYDGVTPFSSGGQPMQIYYMTTKGVSGGASSAVVLIRYFGSMFAFTLFGITFMVAGTALNVLDGVSGRTLLMVFGWVGLVLNCLLPLFILFFVLFPRFARKLTGGLIFLGWKLHIVKRKERAMRRALRTVQDFIDCFRLIARRPLWLALFLVSCFAENALTLSTPYFVMNALSCDLEGMFFAVMALNVFTTFGGSFIPTPGSSGVIEGMGVLAFSVAAGATLAWSVFFWRFSVYYIYIGIGLIWSITDLFRKNIVRKKRA